MHGLIRALRGLLQGYERWLSYSSEIPTIQYLNDLQPRLSDRFGIQSAQSDLTLGTNSTRSRNRHFDYGVTLATGHCLSQPFRWKRTNTHTHTRLWVIRTNSHAEWCVAVPLGPLARPWTDSDLLNESCSTTAPCRRVLGFEKRHRVTCFFKTVHSNLTSYLGSCWAPTLSPLSVLRLFLMENF